jgi:hypothetical protein
MTLESRVERLEDAFVSVAETLHEHTGLLRDHSTLLRDIITLLNAQGDQLERIERAIRERGNNGQAL